MTDAIMPTYGRLDVGFSHGEGPYIWDTNGKKYLDALCGLAVTGLGHARREITEAITDQAGSLLHTSNLYQVGNQSTLADRLTALTGMDNVFFCNSGAEANEAAIKIARLYGHGRDVENPEIIVADAAFHGRTLATLTASGNRKIQAGFEPLVSGFVRVPYDDLDAVREIAARRPGVVAVMVEPIQGEGGVQVPADGYLAGLREICDANEWLLMVDEVQSGMGRTGKFLATEHDGVKADVVMLAKALANGVPIGACLARGKAAEVLVAGTHGSTFGGNPLATRAALSVLDVMEKENLVARAGELGDRMRAGFETALAGANHVVEIRGKGLMIGIELDRDCPELVGHALDKGLLINVAQGNTVRLLPPLVLSDDEADAIVAGVSELIKAL